ncbi:hypothetical protein ABDK56_08360 [Sphingomonas sp. ASV193]
MEVVRIVESRKKVLLLLAASLVFVAIYAFLPDPRHELPSWGGWFFSACGLVFFVLLLRPRTLTLDNAGFSVTGGLARKAMFIKWEDVARFFPVRLGPASTMVGFDYNANLIDEPRGVRLARRVSGADGAIAGAWPGSTGDLAQKLNAYREQVLAARQ